MRPWRSSRILFFSSGSSLPLPFASYCSRARLRAEVTGRPSSVFFPLSGGSWGSGAARSGPGPGRRARVTRARKGVLVMALPPQGDQVHGVGDEPVGGGGIDLLAAQGEELVHERLQHVVLRGVLAALVHPMRVLQLPAQRGG